MTARAAAHRTEHINLQAHAAVREQLLALLRGGNAHTRLEQVVDGFPPKARGTVPAGLPYSAWQLLEHIRLAQQDIVLFSMNYDGTYQSPDWPSGYWPRQAAPPDSKAWDNSVRQIVAGRKRFEKLITNPDSDLFTPFPWGDGQNLLREAMLIADHNAYHLGQLVVLRRLLNIWE
jgi:hypothetical protein